jgi:hypothetical protein
VTMLSAEAGPAQPRAHGRTKATASQAGPCVFFVACDAATASAPDSATFSPTDDASPTTWCEPPAPPREGSRQSYLLLLAVYASDGTRTRDIRRDKAGVFGFRKGTHMPDPLSAGKGSSSRQPGQQSCLLVGGFPGHLSTSHVTDVSEDDARRRSASRVPQRSSAFRPHRGFRLSSKASVP